MAQTSVLGGIHVDVYGLTEQVRASARPLVILFMLHGRFGSASESKTVTWCNRLMSAASAKDVSKDFIVVAFDQRNHGRRVANAQLNFGWNESFKGESFHNVSHAVDTFSMQYGTARDVSFLIDLLPAHLFPNDERTVDEWWCAGVSLGGHATWLILAHEPRVRVGIPIIGSPDMWTLFSKRAEGQKEPIRVGPPHFPQSFIDTLKRLDPCNAPLSAYLNKSLLILSGANDTLVNFHEGGTHDFVQKLQERQDVKTTVFIDEKAGHEFSDWMMGKAVEFITSLLRQRQQASL